MKVWLTTILLTVICCCSAYASEYRTFTSRDGKSIEAKILSLNSSQKVTLELETGQIYKDVLMTLFSSEDQAYILKWEKQREAAEKASFENALFTKDSKILFNVKTSRDNDLNDGGDIDNREVEYEPEVKFENNELKLCFKRVQGTLVFIGQSVVENKEYHVLYREDFTVDLMAGERTSWEGEVFTNVYDDSYPSLFGAKYDGYLILLRDSSGKLCFLKASKAKWEDNYKAILAADMKKAHSRDFSRQSEKSSE